MDIGAFTMTANTKELTALQRWMTTGFRKASGDSDMLVPFIRRFGSATVQNFRQEMWPGHGQDWAKLTVYTQEERSDRGYEPEHPILQQSGQLKNLATTPFTNWRFGQKSIRTKTAVAPYGEETALVVAASIVKTTFTATISGERVKNQMAYHTSRRDGTSVGVPPRPFWGLTSDILQEGLTGKGESVVGMYGTTVPWEGKGAVGVFLAKWHEQKKGLTR